jgi:hypothetical protein
MANTCFKSSRRNKNENWPSVENYCCEDVEKSAQLFDLFACVFPTTSLHVHKFSSLVLSTRILKISVPPTGMATDAVSPNCDFGADLNLKLSVTNVGNKVK